MTLSFTPNGHNELTEVYEAIVELAMTATNTAPAGYPAAEALTNVDSDFKAFTKMPNASRAALPYPFMFPVLSEWSVQDRAMGAGTDKPFDYTISLMLLVGLSSNNFGPLTDEAEQYVIPITALLMANRSLMGTVQNIAFYAPELGFTRKGVMGDITLSSVTHFGLEVPIYIQQRKPIYSHK